MKKLTSIAAVAGFLAVTALMTQGCKKQEAPTEAPAAAVPAAPEAQPSAEQPAPEAAPAPTAPAQGGQ